MALVRWEPIRELHTLQQEVNRIFGSYFDAPGATAANGGTPRRWIPAMDLVETDSAYTLRADLPGLTTDDVKVELEEDVLTVSGERRSEHSGETKDGHHRVERAFGAFSRSLTLPSGVDAEHIEASFVNGVLEISIPKPAAPTPRRVAIGVSTRAPIVEATETAAPASERSDSAPPSIRSRA